MEITDNIADLIADEKRHPLSDRAFEQAFWETGEVLWCNAQWAVTTYGIENVRGPYHYFIEAFLISDLRARGHGGDWRNHMAEKNWVDVQMFEECFEHALRIHAKH